MKVFPCSVSQEPGIVKNPLELAKEFYQSMSREGREGGTSFSVVIELEAYLVCAAKYSSKTFAKLAP